MNRNLDAEIVKVIFKWRYIPVSSDANGENKCEILFPPNEEPTQDFYNTLPRLGKLHEGFHAPNYSRDLRLAIELAKHVKHPMTVLEMPLDAEELSRSCLIWWICQSKN